MSGLKKLTVTSDQANNMRSGKLVWFFLAPTSPIHIKVTWTKVINVLRLSMCSESIAILIQSLREKFIQYSDKTHKYFSKEFLFYFILFFYFFLRVN
jgi:hypothetical protein